MTDRFQTYMSLLDEVRDDPQLQAAIAMEFALATEPDSEHMLKAFDAAAILHWFTPALLEAAVPCSADESTSLFDRLRGYSSVEAYEAAGDGALNVHEATRLGWRRRMRMTRASQFEALSSYSAMAFESSDSARARVQWVYHLLSAAPNQAADELADMEAHWIHGQNPELCSRLADTLEGLLGEGLSDRAELWVHITIHSAREDRMSVAEASNSCSRLQDTILQVQDVRAAAEVATFRADAKVRAGEYAEAEGGYTDALELWQSLLSEQPSDQGLQRAVGLAWSKLGSVRSSQGRLTEAADAFEQHLAVCQDLHRSDPTDFVWHRDLASAWAQLGSVRMALGRSADGVAAHDRQLDLSKALVQANPGKQWLKSGLGFAWGMAGTAQLQLGRVVEATEAKKTALAIAQELADLDPGDTAARAALLEAVGDWGATQWFLGRLTEAARAFDRRLVLSQSLVELDPDNASWRADLARAWTGIGNLLIDQASFGDASGALAHALRTYEELVATDPENTSWKLAIAGVWGNIGELNREQGLITEARQMAEKKHAMVQTLADRAPDNKALQLDLALSWGTVGSLRLRDGDVGGGFTALEMSRVLHQTLVDYDPTNGFWRSALGSAWALLGHAHSNQADFDLADRAYTTGADEARTVVAMHSESTLWKRYLSASLQGVAGLRRQQGRLRDAQDALEKSISLSEELIEESPHNRALQQDLAQALLKAAVVLQMGKRGSEANDAVKRATRVLKALTRTDMTHARAKVDLASCYEARAILHLEQGAREEARTYASRALSVYEELLKLAPSIAEWLEAVARLERLEERLLAGES